MAKVPLTKDSEFIVGEEKVLVYVLAFLFFGLFVYGLIDVILLNTGKTDPARSSGGFDAGRYVFLLALIPAFLFFRKGRANRIYIRINKTGIYQDGRLVTNWPNFINAFITQKETTITIQDNFQLVLEYRKNENSTIGLRRKIALTNTQNKSEEDVMSAINFFWAVYKRTVTY